MFVSVLLTVVMETPFGPPMSRQYERPSYQRRQEPWAGQGLRSAASNDPPIGTLTYFSFLWSSLTNYSCVYSLISTSKSQLLRAAQCEKHVANSNLAF